MFAANAGSASPVAAVTTAQAAAKPLFQKCYLLITIFLSVQEEPPYPLMATLHKAYLLTSSDAAPIFFRTALHFLYDIVIIPCFSDSVKIKPHKADA